MNKEKSEEQVIEAEETGLVHKEELPVASTPLDLPTEQFQEGLDKRNSNRTALLNWIKDALVEDTDFGEIEGKTKSGKKFTTKPSLWKPGAEKICGMLGLKACYPGADKYEEAAVNGNEINQIILKCYLKNSAGQTVGEGMGARTLRQDGGDLNKSLKMAKKSAMVDAVLQTGGLSEVFTQDLEDMPDSNPKPASTSRQRPQSQQDPSPGDAPQMATENQKTKLRALCSQLYGKCADEKRHAIIRAFTKSTRGEGKEVESSKAITKSEATSIIDRLQEKYDQYHNMEVEKIDPIEKNGWTTKIKVVDKENMKEEYIAFSGREMGCTCQKENDDPYNLNDPEPWCLHVRKAMEIATKE